MPAKPPRDVLEKLQGELVRIIQSPDYKQRQLEVATDVVGSSAEALASLQKTEIEKYRKIAAAAGIKPE
jgi:tripartite-type tricarboxylate transporter receptor subunit TctC